MTYKLRTALGAVHKVCHAIVDDFWPHSPCHKLSQILDPLKVCHTFEKKSYQEVNIEEIAFK